MEIQWRKCESVMTGGKVFFWQATTSHGSFWITWNRAERKYTVGQVDCGSLQALGTCRTPTEGMNIAQKWLNKQGGLTHDV